jgi:hypothetical protein
LRDFAALPMSALYLSVYSGLLLFCIIIIVLFIVGFTLFYSFSFSYARLVVRTWRD